MSSCASSSDLTPRYATLLYSTLRHATLPQHPRVLLFVALGPGLLVPVLDSNYLLLVVDADRRDKVGSKLLVGVLHDDARLADGGVADRWGQGMRGQGMRTAGERGDGDGERDARERKGRETPTTPQLKTPAPNTHTTSCSRKILTQ